MQRSIVPTLGRTEPLRTKGVAHNRLRLGSVASPLSAGSS